ncbi:hypothetical protein EVAR_19693_1 [Eumeta japonica]|uniref:Uncharacterized protein n=1 Tax=Eumeta variegata TaxID=151549 RepID=A0A4C1V223_EUMVA|nr:hypothetical protein EVAR_19693_1 [Eumeta japonica]
MRSSTATKILLRVVRGSRPVPESKSIRSWKQKRDRNSCSQRDETGRKTTGSEKSVFTRTPRREVALCQQNCTSSVIKMSTGRVSDSKFPNTEARSLRSSFQTEGAEAADDRRGARRIAYF